MMNSSSTAALALHVSFLMLLGCSAKEPAEAPTAAQEEEAEAIARTEFTDRIENFFEYEPLRAGKPSMFRIHLTDLADGSPVEQAQVQMTVRRGGSTDSVVQTTAKIGKVTGIYVAEVIIPEPGGYEIEFHIKNSKLDERLPLTDFKVE